MAEIFDFGFQKYRLKLSGVYNQNGLFAVVGDTARRIEVQLLDAAGRVTDTTGIELSLSTPVGQSASYVDANLIDASKGLYQVDLTNGLFLKPGKQDFQWTIYKDGNKINSVVSRWHIDKNVSEGGNQSFNFYLNADDLKRKTEELEAKQDEIKSIQADMEAENAAMISETESMQQEVRDIQQDFVDDTVESEALRISVEQSLEERYSTLEADYAQDLSELKQNDDALTAQLADITINAKTFGAVGNGIADDTKAIQDAIDYIERNLINAEQGASGYTLFFPRGIYLITETLVIDKSIIIKGENRGSELRNMSTTGSDAISYSQTNFIFNAGISNVSIICGVDAGHAISFPYGVSMCAFRDLYLFVRNPSKSCIYQNRSAVQNGGFFDTIFEGGEYFGERWNRTAPIIDITVTGSSFNENTIRNLRIHGASLLQAIQIKNTHPTTQLVNNSFKNLNFEICAGGGLYLESVKANIIENISFWDCDEYVNDLIDLTSPNGHYAANGNTLSTITRHSGALTNCVDINFGNSLDSVLINFNPPTVANAIIEFNGMRVTCIGRVSATMRNAEQIMHLSALNGANSPVFQVNNAGKIYQVNGSLIIDSAINGKNIKLITKNSSGVSKEIALEPDSDTLFALTDKTINLGKQAYRFKNTFSEYFRPGDGDVLWYSGAGTPEGRDIAKIGSMYTRTDGGVGTTLYIKESGTGNTGWVAK